MDLWEGRGGRGHYFFFEIMYYFMEFRLRKLKSISNRAVLNVLATPFWIFWIRRAPVFFLNFLIRSQEKQTSASCPSINW